MRETRGNSEWSHWAAGRLPSDGPNQFGPVGSPVGLSEGAGSVWEWGRVEKALSRTENSCCGPYVWESTIDA